MSDPSLGIIDAADFDIDPETEEGKEELSFLAWRTHHEHPAINHFLFEHHGARIGEMIFMPHKDSKEWN